MGTRCEWKKPVIMQIVRHSEQTLKTALVSKNPVLVSQYEKLDAGKQRLMNEAFQPASDLFGPITLHSPSDWITSHLEAPQVFEQFFSDPYRKTPSPDKCSIYIYSPLVWGYSALPGMAVIFITCAMKAK
ncbi:hypothetical protein H8959_009236 [Pygathrix nigripes]